MDEAALDLGWPAGSKVSRLSALRRQRQQSRSLRAIKRLVREAPTPTVQSDLMTIVARYAKWSTTKAR
jgi:hypothetical protein